ncbi:MAG TPA: glycosyltransferase family 4 protein, partial [Candidatus Dormibacteraeota bacterium]|nr:glycosyltransferase family 4 protein [Candidatus Dormibacteraeota bacterium]
MPHVIQIGFFDDPRGRGPEELLTAWSTLADVAESACSAGLEVTLVQTCARRAQFERNGVHYRFLPFGLPLTPAAELAELLRALAPDVLHVHGLGFHREVAWLAASLPHVPIILQDHASRVPAWWRRRALRRTMGFATGVAFCSLAQSDPFVRAGIISGATRRYSIPESTSRFSPGDPAAARRRNGIAGDPALLWVGHLDANKDPLTILAGVSAVAAELPDTHLYCCFGTAPLRVAVEARISSDPMLRGRVTLLGRVPHERVEELMRAADLFVLGSHREGSGYSLIEALACGLPPVVTDLPSYRELTAGGAVGELWRCGDAAGLAAALLRAAARTGALARRAVREH